MLWEAKNYFICLCAHLKELSWTSIVYKGGYTSVGSIHGQYINLTIESYLALQIIYYLWYIYKSHESRWYWMYGMAIQVQWAWRRREQISYELTLIRGQHELTLCCHTLLPGHLQGKIKIFSFSKTAIKTIELVREMTLNNWFIL